MAVNLVSSYLLHSLHLLSLPLLRQNVDISAGVCVCVELLKIEDT